MDLTRRYNNGTEKTWNGDANLDNEVITVPYGFLIIRANANPTEKIYPSGGHSTLNTSSTRTYPVGQIETIRYLSVDTRANSYESTEIYFQRATGAAAEFRYESRETRESYTTTVKEVMILQRSNVDLRPTLQQNMLLIILIIVLIIIILLALWILRRSKKLKQKQETVI